MMFSNKKAAGETNLGKIFLVLLLVLIISYLIWLFFIQGFVEKVITECPNNYCKNECNFALDYQDNTRFCDNKEQVCCKPINPATNPVSAECAGKKEGDYCAGKSPGGNDIPKVCDSNYKCEELCVYCSSNPSKDVCKFTTTQIIGKSITSFSGGFDCGCTQSECKPGIGFTCLKSFCSSTTPSASDYYCCNK